MRECATFPHVRGCGPIRLSYRWADCRGSGLSPEHDQSVPTPWPDVGSGCFDMPIGSARWLVELKPMHRRYQTGETLMTAEQVADRWQVHRDTIYRIPRTRLPYLQIGRGTRRYTWADVEAYESRVRVGGVR
jgi:hypothetical protein